MFKYEKICERCKEHYETNHEKSRFCSFECVVADWPDDEE